MQVPLQSRWRRFYAPLKSCSDAGAASSGGDASTRRSNPARRQVPLQRWRRFYAPLKSCSEAGSASSSGGATTRRSKPPYAGAASSGRDASTRRSHPDLMQVPLQAAAALLRAAQIIPSAQVPLSAVAALLRAAQTLPRRRCRFQRSRRFHAPFKSDSSGRDVQILPHFKRPRRF